MIAVIMKNGATSLPVSSSECRQGVSLPCGQPYWNKLCHHIELLKDLKSSTSVKELERVLRDIQRVTEEDSAAQRTRMYPPPSVGGEEFYFEGLIHFLDHDASPEERATFFQRILPTIATLALDIEQLKPQEALNYCLQQQDGQTQIPRQFAASLLAHSFLCTLPPQTSVDLNQINFRFFFKHLKNLSLQKAQAAKLRCVLNYFRRLSEVKPSGNLIITRKVFPPELMPSLDTWDSSEVPLCALIVKQEGALESAGSDVMQVDFANRYIGGGVLSSGLVQEEIRFITCPELIACLTLVECMQDNEAVQVSGFEQYSDYSGYSRTFAFRGNYQDNLKVDALGNLETTLLAIDASEFYDTSDDQYRGNYLLRDLNKAFVGFLPSLSMEREDSTGDDSEEFSFHTVTTERSHLTAETDFETASEGPEIPKTDTGCSYDLNHITNYGNALSKAITDIAVKDASIIQNGDSLDGSISEDELEHLHCDEGQDMSMGADWSLLTENSYISREMKNFCEQLTDDVILSVLSDNMMKRGDSELVGEINSSGMPGSIPNRLHHAALEDDDLKGLVNNLVSSAVTEALHQKRGCPCIPENSSEGSPSSSEDFISSISGFSEETFAKVGQNGDCFVVSTPEEQYRDMVANYVSDVIDQAVSMVRRLDDIEEGRPLLSSSDRLDRRRGQENHVGSCWNDAGVRSRLLHNLDLSSANISGVGATNDPYQGHGDGSDVLRLAAYQGPVVNIIPNSDIVPTHESVDPPSLLNPIHVPTLGGVNLHYEGEPGSFQINRMSEDLHRSAMMDTFSDGYDDYVEEYDDYLDDIDSELDHMIAAASRRSSSRSGSASSKPPNLDNFTEGLLKIANIDPQGRRPSRTEESLQYFSAELAKRVERDRYNLRRESDFDRFAFDLFHDHGVPRGQAGQRRSIREEVANACASRLAADIMQDVAIQMFGTVFPHSVRLIPAREGDFPPRREPSEVDLLSLAANLANTILESAMQTYRRDYLLGGRPQSRPVTPLSMSEELESEMNSRFAQIDENSVCESTVTEDIVSYKMRMEDEVHYSSVDEMAWNMSSAIVSDTYREIRKVRMLQGLFERSLNIEQRPLATGNWGCGVYGGDPQMKSLIQWMAASQAGIRTVFYYSFNDTRVEQLPEVTQLLRMRGWTVGRTAKFIRGYCQKKLTTVNNFSKQDLFREILSQKLTT